MLYYTTEQLGSKQRLTPEGFLLCEEVPIARLGVLYYAAGETPIEPAADGIARVSRDEAALFSQQTIASFSGKAVTNEHPDEKIDPDNWREYATGSVSNVRRGEGINADCLLADLLITDAAAIADVRGGKREVSCGYEADYEDTGPGTGRQTNIIGNHVALVEKGRCGPRCSIGDQAMPVVRRKIIRQSAADKIRLAFKTGDAAAMEEALSGLPDNVEGPAAEALADTSGDQHIHLHINSGPGNGSEPVANTGARIESADDGEGSPMNADPAAPDASAGDPMSKVLAILESLDARISALEQSAGGGDGDADNMGDPDPAMPQADELPADFDPDKKGAQKADEDGGEKEVTKDSSGLSGDFAMALSNAELLVPGTRAPTFDARAKRQQSLDALCAFKRGVLSKALADADTAEALKQTFPRLTVDAAKKLPCGELSVTFDAAAGIMRQHNNSKLARSGTIHLPTGTPKAPPTPAELNAKFAALRQRPQ